MRIKIAFVQLLPGIDLDENLDCIWRPTPAASAA